jgi:hypothetical protein
MTVYGTKIQSDIDFGLGLSHETQTRYTIQLRQTPPGTLTEEITCGAPLYRAHGRRVYLYSDRPFEGNTPGQPWCYEVQDIVSFYWKGGERTIYYTLHEKGDAALLGFWFVHLLLPFFYTLEEMYEIFHGGAVEVDGKAIMFAAPSTGGKSTMTDYFIRQGHTLISDDKIPTFIEDGKLMLVGAHPYHRPYRKFEDLGYRVDTFSRKFQPLHALYLLEKADEDAPVSIEEVHGFQKFREVLPYYLFSFAFRKKRRMNYLATCVNSVRVFRVKRPWDMHKLDQVYKAILTHADRLD